MLVVLGVLVMLVVLIVGRAGGGDRGGGRGGRETIVFDVDAVVVVAGENRRGPNPKLTSIK